MSEPNLLDPAPRAEFADALEDQLRRVLSGESRAEQPSRVAVADRSAVTARPRHRVASGLAAAAAVAAIAVTGVVISGRPDRNQGPTPAPTTTLGSVPVTNPDTSPVTSPTTDAITTTSVLLPHQPRLGANDAGTYAIRPFLVPFQLTTTGEWIRSINGPNGLALGRGTTVSFVVSTGAFPGTSAAEVVANLCPAGTLDAAAPVTTTLLGAPAIRSTPSASHHAAPRSGPKHGRSAAAAPSASSWPRSTTSSSSSPADQPPSGTSSDRRSRR